MTEKHHPASSAEARKRAERGQRRETKQKLAIGDKRQRKVFKQPTGFVRGARATK